jgi:spermidine synthase
MRVARPWALELEYTRDMMLALLLRPAPRWPASVLLIGLGAASLPKYLYRNRPHAALTVVEIDAAVVNAAAQYFKLPEDPRRLAIEIGDGHDYVTATERRYDLIVVDGYDAKCRVGMLDTLPFYCACRARLTDAGLLVTNFLNRHRGLGGSLKRMDAAFDSRVCALPACSSWQHHRGSGNGRRDRRLARAVEVGRARLETRHRPQSAAGGCAHRPAASRHFGALRALTAGS